MIALKAATIHKYKSIETEQTLNLNQDITVLVGLNESGKTSILEALAKTNYFEADTTFKFNLSHDYPRREKKKIDKAGITPKAVTSLFSISTALQEEIAEDIGAGVFTQTEFSTRAEYDNIEAWLDVQTDLKAFIKIQTQRLSLSSELAKNLSKIHSLTELQALQQQHPDQQENLQNLEKYFQNQWAWTQDPISEYVARHWLAPHLPKFLYYDEFYSLPSRISIESLQNQSLTQEAQKTAKALFELADINLNEILNADDFEDFKAELEATEVSISEEMFRYWTSNTNLEIKFDIDKKTQTDANGQQQVIEHILDIRVRNNRTRMSLPLKNRSKGFNWFFSFLVWFKKIQEHSHDNYVLLLDEPGLNLHASAQADLLAFIEHLAQDYPIIYTTHSPFMLNQTAMERVRTVVETENGTQINELKDETDKKTLYPLQASMAYGLCQHLFEAPKYYLLVETSAELVYLQSLSSYLQAQNYQGLNPNISIMPVGGLSSISRFNALLNDAGAYAGLFSRIPKMQPLKSKLLSYQQFNPSIKAAEFEDLFSKTEYLKLLHSAYPEHKTLKASQFKDSKSPFLSQIRPHFEPDRLLIAQQLAQQGQRLTVSKKNLERFEKLFQQLNAFFTTT